MLKCALFLLLAAIGAGGLLVSGLPPGLASVARLLFFVFVILFALAMLGYLVRGHPPSERSPPFE